MNLPQPNSGAGIDSEGIVRKFIDAFRLSWPADFDVALAPVAEDGSYQIVVPALPPIKGRANIKAELIRMKQSATEQKHDMINVAANGNVVFTERVDRSMRNGKWIAIPLVAVFELNDAGQIQVWREYLDLAHAAKQHGISAEALYDLLKIN